MNFLQQARRPLQIGTGTLALFGIPYASGRFLGTGSGSYIIMGVTFGALLVFGGIFYLCYRLWKRGKGNSLSKMLRKEAGSSQIEGVESLRSNFEEGVEKLRKAGKNVYEIPWFLLAGQAGAGKTEAIRRSHSKEDFPPGLNDLMQGVGGTLNMNWWFANKAIILDTAGRIFEEKIHAGQSNEWLEFLKMLKRARKNMPINGFILTIPADSLIRDSINEIEQKASHIAEQLTVVQNTLGVRFPVFVLISKTDFIPGFREFVENVSEPRLQQQMLGWSNPKHLDEPFAPEQVESYLSGVIDKLKKRRLTYMLDPHPQNGGKRIDDLDALFTFPYHLKSAVPNLQRYLEIVFSLNPWSDKPLFIRGIYFTSSLQQGEALDQAIASVMGKDLGEMALSSFKKETPLFLRDMFFDKVYREYGLVTSARKVSAAMRRRALLFGSFGVLAVGAILAAAFYGGRSFQEQVGDESLHWQRAATELEGAEEKTLDLEKWGQPIVFSPPVGSFSVDSNQDYEFRVGSEKVAMPEYLARLGDYASRPLDVPAVFRPLRFFDKVFSSDRLDREKAFRRVFETSVIYPILGISSDKLLASSSDSWTESDVKGLRAMIQMQALLNQEPDARGPEFSNNFFKALDALHQYLVGEPLEDEIETVFFQYYGPEYVAETGWPSSSQSTLYAASKNLEEDEQLAGIRKGLEIWRLDTAQLSKEFESDMLTMKSRLAEFDTLAASESVLLKQADQGQMIDAASATRLGERLKSLNNDVVKDYNPAVEGEFRFAHALSEREGLMQEQLEARITDLKRAFDNIGQDDPLIATIKATVEKAQNDANALKEKLLNRDLRDKAAEIDRVLLDEAGGLEARLGMYRKFEDALGGMQGVQLNSYQEAEAAITDAEAFYATAVEAVRAYDGHDASRIEKSFGQIASLKRSEKMDFFVRAFLNDAVNKTGAKLGFPVLLDDKKTLTRGEIAELNEFLLDLIARTKGIMQQTETGADARLQALLDDLQKIERFVSDRFRPEVLDYQVEVGIPAIERLDGTSGLRRSIFWNARLVNGSNGQTYRMGEAPLKLTTVALDAKRFGFAFQSTVDGAPGDSGEFSRSGEWVVLRAILSPKAAPDTSFRSTESKRFLFRETLTTSGTKGKQEFSYSLTVPIELPSAEGWLKAGDLDSLTP